MLTINEMLSSAADELETQLGEQTVTVHRNAPTGEAPDPETLEVPADDEDCTVVAAVGPEERIPIGEGGKHHVARTFSVRAASMTFTPSRGNTVVDQGGGRWRVTMVVATLAGAGYDLVTKRMS